MVNYRPLRQVISVRPGDTASLRSAIVHCTKVWGGVLNLIALEEVPGEWTEMTRSFVSLADLDYVTVLGENAASRGRQLTKASTSPPLSLQLLHGELAPPFITAGMVDQLGSSLTYLPTGDALPLHYAASWGDMAWEPDERSSLGNPSFYLTQWGPAELSPLCRTVAGLRCIGRDEFLSDDALTLVPVPSPNAVPELVLLWNIRALCWPFPNGVGMLPLWETVSARDFRHHIAAFLAHADPSRRSVRILDIPDHSSRAHELIDEIRTATVDDASHTRLTPTIDIKYLFGKAVLPPHPRRLSAGTSIHLGWQPAHSLAVLLAPPVQEEGICVVDVLDEPRLRLPPRPHLGELFYPGGRATGDGMAVNIRPLSQRALEMRLPSDLELVSSIIERAGLRYTRSSGARHVEQLLRAVGDDLGDVILRDQMVIGILRQLAPHRDARLVEADAAELPRKKLTLAQISGRLGQPTEAVWQKISDLVAARILFAGVEVVCHDCRLTQWRIVDDLATTMTCLGCRAPISFTAHDARGASEPRWTYSLNEAYANLFAQGTAAVVVALAYLRREAHDAFHFITGLDIVDPMRDQEDSAKTEIDAVVIADDRTVVLEAKSAGHIDGRQARSSLDVAAALDATACFATLEIWDDAARDLFAGAAAKLDLSVLNGAELLRLAGATSP